MKELIKVSFIADTIDKRFITPSIVLGFDWTILIVLISLIIGFLLLFLVLRKRIFKRYSIVPVKVEIGKDFKVECRIERNEENIFIAHRIYIELVTRKAAIDLDIEHDLISEIYDSWYILVDSQLKPLISLL